MSLLVYTKRHTHTRSHVPECLSGRASALPQVNQTGGAAGGGGRFAVAHVHAHHCARGEGTAHITLWFGENDVHLLRNETPYVLDNIATTAKCNNHYNSAV